jgi:hypothetical protein
LTKFDRFPDNNERFIFNDSSQREFNSNPIEDDFDRAFKQGKFLNNLDPHLSTDNFNRLANIKRMRAFYMIVVNKQLEIYDKQIKKLEALTMLEKEFGLSVTRKIKQPIWEES